MPLHLEYRPKTLKEVEGNRAVVESLRAILQRESDRPHAFLFTGPSGCGKTTLGRIVASELGCDPADLKEVDVADFRGIDSVRDIRQQSRLRPIAGPCRVWILDEAHKQTNDAQNALLKILEDTPDHVYFIICTTEPHKLLKTIRSRCTPFTVEPLAERSMIRLLTKVAEKEGKTFPAEIYKQLYQSSLGHPRAALVMLDKVIDLPPNRIQRAIEKAATEESQVIDLCRMLLKKESWKKLAPVIKSIQESQEPETVRWAVLGYMNSVLLGGVNLQAAQIIENFKEPFFNSGKAGLTSACFDSIMLE